MSGIRSNLKGYIYPLLFLTFWFLIFLNLPHLCSANQDHHQHHHHQHHHHGHDESPSFKYSKHANEPYEDKVHDHEHKSEHPWLSWLQSLGLASASNLTEESWSIWTQALVSTLLISAAPFFILFLVPLDKSKEKESFLKILLSFASGGLLGDSFLHLIPHALGSHSHGEKGSHADHKHDKEDGHSHGHIGFFVLLGIVVFLVVEKSVRLVNTGHSHSHSVENKSLKKDIQEKGDYSKKEKDLKKGSSKKKKQKGVISVSGYLNLAADFTHNLTDGLAIGASYLAGKNIGFITTLTILLHEVPHEIGDFAILIQSGCSRRKAMGLQLITALGAVMGTLIALMTEGAGDIASSWILPFTAGGFIYISTVSIIPELLEDSNFFQSLKEIVAILVGVFLMVLIADIE